LYNIIPKFSTKMRTIKWYFTMCFL